ncbi:MAG: glycosyltransferase, partial [Pseudomonadota bacterium]
MDRFFHLSFLICLGYFVSVNAYYFLILLFSWLENRFRIRQESRENLAPVLESDFTIPVSVVIPAYNEQDVLNDAILAVLKNGYPNFELIVVNDGSTDRTMEFLKRDYLL